MAAGGVGGGAEEIGGIGFVDLCKAASEGTTNRVRLKEERFLATSIALPSLGEQQRIVARIEELAAKIKEAICLRSDIETETYSLLAATYHRIKGKTEILFSPQEVQQIISAIKLGMRPKTWATRKEHVAGLKERFDNITICPKCSSELILRTVKSGEKAGNQFYGCSQFPKCRYMKPA